MGTLQPTAHLPNSPVPQHVVVAPGQASPVDWHVHMEPVACLPASLLLPMVICWVIQYAPYLDQVRWTGTGQPVVHVPRSIITPMHVEVLQRACQRLPKRRWELSTAFCAVPHVAPAKFFKPLKSHNPYILQHSMWASVAAAHLPS